MAKELLDKDIEAASGGTVNPNCIDYHTYCKLGLKFHDMKDVCDDFVMMPTVTNPREACMNCLYGAIVFDQEIRKSGIACMINH